MFEEVSSPRIADLLTESKTLDGAISTFPPNKSESKNPKHQTNHVASLHGIGPPVLWPWLMGNGQITSQNT